MFTKNYIIFIIKIVKIEALTSARDLIDEVYKIVYVSGEKEERKKLEIH